MKRDEEETAKWKEGIGRIGVRGDAAGKREGERRERVRERVRE
jgi:hypothetical protein